MCGTKRWWNELENKTTGVRDAQLSFLSRLALRDSGDGIKFYFLTFSLISFELSCSSRSILKLNGRLEEGALPLEIAVTS